MERKAARTDGIPEVHAEAHGLGGVKGKAPFLPRAEKVVEQAQAVYTGNGPGGGVQLSKALGQSAVHPAKPGSGLLDLPLRDGDGDVLFLDQVVALRRFPGQQAVVFPAIAVQAVPLLLHEDGLGKVRLVQAAVDNGDLGGGIGGQSVEGGGVGAEDAALVLVGGRGVVDVGEAPSAAVLAAHLENPVVVDPLDGDGPLYASGNEKAVPFTPIGGGKGLTQSCHAPFCPAPGNRYFRRQSPAFRQTGIWT